MLRKIGQCFIGSLAVIALSACAQTSHPSTSASLGKPVRSSVMEALIDKPGPIEVKTIASADWVADLSGLINLKDPQAIQAGLKDHEEPIQIYTHLVRHPTQGFYMVDTGVSKRFVEDPKSLGVGWVVRNFAKLDKMQVREDTLSAIKSEAAPLKGVLMTHLHLDHISGMSDIPKDVPFYTGPGEAAEKKIENFFVEGMEDVFFEGRPAIQEFQFTGDPDGKFEGVIDVFGDGSLFAILTPGHTAGHVSYLARTPSGPVLLTGDACHTRWGWEHGVEPGSFTYDREEERKSLLALKALSERHPQMIVKLGHQP
ncbi:MBL fold metallo-hydrolase [Bradyrhizobium pachyrhizi]|uniref:MBL fold metallo-hydrolase n=1 Tax=Bradyrhizobium TaxID=374 RepID=UPI00067D2DA0|nr:MULTISPECIES: MBL fold metallo-hydrolase [Bradyrhizobium]WFU54254.1 MBL fold metallo-hydrolase [Bradyrhizobium pachyrhizi]WOH79939.1 MBL fold metallo-hydrolase [Bradyrhizobium sp. BEA-2-5]